MDTGHSLISLALEPVTRPYATRQNDWCTDLGRPTRLPKPPHLEEGEDNVARTERQ